MLNVLKVATLFAALIGTNAFAVQTCTLMIPEDCEVIGTEYSASPHDTTHVVTVTCRTHAGQIATYLTSRQAIMSTILGFGRDFLPRKISYATWTQDAIQIDCR